jgi:hypothetical protein
VSAPDTAVDIQALGTAMIDAARDTLVEHGAELHATAETEFRRLAGALNDTGLQLVRGEIDREHAQKLLSIHRLSIRSVLRSVEGMTLLAAEHAVQAAMRTAAGTLNRVSGFKLVEVERNPSGHTTEPVPSAATRDATKPADASPATDASVNGTPDFKAGKDITR